MTRRIAILFSGTGTNMVALAQAMQSGGFPGKICLALTNRADAAGIERARALGLPVKVVDHRPFQGDRTRFDAALDAELRLAGADLVCLAGFMRILTPGFVQAWAGRMLNIHPSLLPLFTGLDTHARALAAGVAVHGATVHLVTEELDAGPILGQAVVPVERGDTAETLQARVLAMEHVLYPRTLWAFLEGNRDKIALFP